MPGPDWKLEDDLKTVTVTFPSDPPVALKLDADEVDDTLRNLGEFRASMDPPIPEDHPLGQKTGAIPDPKWVTEPEIMAGNSLLHIRDPRFGWLHYLLPRVEARKLAEFLLNQTDQPPEQAPEKTN